MLGIASVKCQKPIEKVENNIYCVIWQAMQQNNVESDWKSQQFIVQYKKIFRLA